MGKFSLQIDVNRLQLQRILSKLGRGNPLFRQDVRKIMEDTAAQIERKATRRAPIGESHQLSTSIRRYVDKGPIPLWASVKADASNRGFRYGWALQSSKKIPYRYQSGPRAGRLTRRWFTGAMAGMKKRVQRQLEELAGKVEQRWRS